VPDVSLNADPYTGYSVYYSNAFKLIESATPTYPWVVIGGTSAAAPLWAAFHTLVNQQRVANGLSAVGNLNTLLYGFAATTRYQTIFHDIADGSNNGYYKAVSGYDMATGLGSYNGSKMLAALAPPQINVTIPVTVTAPKTGAWSFFSVPYDFTDYFSSTSETLTDALFGAYWGDATSHDFVESWNPAVSTTVYSDLTSIQPGYGYWGYFKSAPTITQPGLASDPSKVFDVTLNSPYGSQPGWTMIGDPFTNSVAVSNLKLVYQDVAYSMAYAISHGLIAYDTNNSVLWYYNGTATYGGVTSTGYIQPLKGYWIAPWLSGMTLEFSPS
jgi:hypothetical protein